MNRNGAIRLAWLLRKFLLKKSPLCNPLMLFIFVFVLCVLSFIFVRIYYVFTIIISCFFLLVSSFIFIMGFGVMMIIVSVSILDCLYIMEFQLDELSWKYHNTVTLVWSHNTEVVGMHAVLLLSKRYSGWREWEITCKRHPPPVINATLPPVIHSTGQTDALGVDDSWGMKTV